MSEERKDLTAKLKAHYRSRQWKVTESAGHLEAVGPHGVKWIGRAVVAEDFCSEDFEAEIIDLAERRMPEGNELRPLDLLPARDCQEELNELLERNGLSRCTHISVYSASAAA
ncbi:MAG: hypothetical protein KJ006_01985 [Thermoleophilia bacterium]|nr:hypothetical protein [Thermoleophilia bacterium]